MPSPRPNSRAQMRRHRMRRRRRRTFLVVVLLAAGAVAGVLATSGSNGPVHKAAGGDSTTTSGGTHSATTVGRTKGKGTAGGNKTAGNHTFLGPYGVESSAIVEENKKPGTTAWTLTGASTTGTIEGFANTTYATAGQTVTLYVSTTAPTFSVTAYRMGYYQGNGARAVWSTSGVAGRVQTPCPVTPGVNMVSCDNWSPSLTVTITKAFVQGDYLFKLTGSGGQESYVQLTVWNPTSTAAYLVMARSLTEQGWNTFGGYDFYEGKGACTLGQTGSYPPCNRARIVSFDRPYSTGDGASDFLGDEYPLVRFMEQHGLDAAYCTDITVIEHPTVLLKHKALLSLGHDETWTWGERTAAQAALAKGVNIVFFGAAPLVRHARLQSSTLGADREEVDYRNSTEDPLLGKGQTDTVTGNTFATPPTSAPVTTLVGAEYSGYLTPGVTPEPLVVSAATAWIFKGTGLVDGSKIPDVVDSDINHVNPGAVPASLEVFFHSPVPLNVAYTNQGTWGGYTYADTTYYTLPNGGAGVFQGGTTNWIFAINPCASHNTNCTNVPLATVTGNLLSVFGQGPAGQFEPSVANWQALTPPGS